MFFFFFNFFSIFYPSLITTPIKSHGYRLTPTNEKIFISHSTFFNLSSTNGGAISIITSIEVFSLIQFSFFYKCFVTGGIGGAIQFQSISSSSILYSICANQCNTGSNSWTTGGQFCNIETGSSKKNELYFLSILKCSDSILNNREVCIGFRNGNQIGKNLNLSNNKAKSYSGILFHNPLSSNISYCQFNNNEVNSYVFTAFMYSSNFVQLYYINSISNINLNDIYGLFYAEQGKANFIKSIFIDNNKYLFTTSPGYPGNINVIDCWIYHEFSFISKNINIYLNNISYSKTIEFQIQFFKTSKCHAEFFNLFIYSLNSKYKKIIIILFVNHFII